MKKKYFISIFIVLIISLITVCSLSANDKNKVIQENVMKLNINEFSSESLIASAENNIDEKYEINNSDITITDAEGNSLQWFDLKNSKVIEVYYSGGIKEVYPAVFEKIIKIVIIG
ncbi:hypothetical protein [uncultured Clostridium sp.]|uniref:hypothetical protein n=1 Tax=uncultured Clostridium sp. TaxID=59620 RepID=UPI0025CCE4B1|nr:hypothetical protein [uncultured Clostridium sp.]